MVRLSTLVRASVALLLLPLFPAAAPVAADSLPDVVLAEGSGAGPGWATLGLQLPAGTDLWIDLDSDGVRGSSASGFFLVETSGRGTGGMSFARNDGAGVFVRADAGGPDADLVLVPREGTEPRTDGGGLGWTLTRPFDGTILILHAGDVETRRWRIVTDGPGEAWPLAEGATVGLATEDDFSHETRVDAEAVVGASAAAGQSHALQVAGGLWGMYAHFNAATCAGCGGQSVASFGYEGPEGRHSLPDDAAAYALGQGGFSTVPVYFLGGEAAGGYDFFVDAIAQTRVPRVASESCGGDPVCHARYWNGIVLVHADVPASAFRT